MVLRTYDNGVRVCSACISREIGSYVLGGNPNGAPKQIGITLKMSNIRSAAL